MGVAYVIAALREFTDRVFGRGEAAITVPPFDGALKPNQLLEEAAVVAELAEPEDLATDGRSLFVSDGSRLLRLDGSQLHEVDRFDRNITALVCLPDGAFAAANTTAGTGKRPPESRFARSMRSRLPQPAS